MSERQVIHSTEHYLPIAAEFPDPCEYCQRTLGEHAAHDIGHGMMQYTCPGEVGKITKEDLAQARAKAKERLDKMTFE